MDIKTIKAIWNKNSAQNRAIAAPKSYPALTDCDAIMCPSEYSHELVGNRKYKKYRCIDQALFCKYRDGITLTEPGTYVVTQNLKFNPCHKGSTAIAIKGEGITLDFKNFTLKQTNTVENCYLVAVCRGSRCVKVTGKKGLAKLVDASLVGIRVLGDTDQIILENIIVTRTEKCYLNNSFLPENWRDMQCATVKAGIAVGEGDTEFVYMKGTSSENLVTNITIDNVESLRSHIGMQLIYTNNGTVTNSSFNENTFKGAFVGTIWVIPTDVPGVPATDLCVGITFDKCHFDFNELLIADTTYPLKDDGESVGYNLGEVYTNNECRSVTVLNSTFNNNYCDTRAIFVDHDGAADSVWKNCEILNNFALGPSEGLHFSGSIPNSYGGAFDQEYPYVLDQVGLVENVVVQSIVSKDGFAFGFAFLGCHKFVVKDCVSSSILGGGLGAAFTPRGTGGYFIAADEAIIPNLTNKDVTLCRCVSNGNEFPNFSKLDINELYSSHGISIIGDNKNIIIDNCKVNNNFGSTSIQTVVPASAGIVVGPLVAAPKNVLIKDSVVNGCGTDEDLPAKGGIYLLDGASDSIIIQDNTVTNNSGVGIRVGEGNTRVVVKRNEADNNTSTGFEILSDALVAANVAIGNNVNYSGVDPANIVTGTNSAVPTEVGFRNVSIE